MVVETQIGHSTRDSITIRGYDLANDLMGEQDFVSVAFLQMIGRLPNEREKAMLNVILVVVSDHGLTPSALSARLTYFGAPESLQGAVASGLLGAGTRILGAMQEASALLRNAVSEYEPIDAGTFSETAQHVIDTEQAAGRRLPGFGHPIHLDGDPRVPRLKEIARENGFFGPHLTLAEAIEERLNVGTRQLPMNAAAAIGGIVSDMSLPPSLARGLALVGRAAGLVAHILEESEAPLAREIWSAADSSVSPR